MATKSQCLVRTPNDHFYDWQKDYVDWLDSIGGLYTPVGEPTIEEIVKEAKQRSIRALSVGGDWSFDRLLATDLQPLADQLIVLGVGCRLVIDSDGFGPFTALQRLQVAEWTGPMDFGQFPVLTQLKLGELNRRKLAGLSSLWSSDIPLETLFVGSWPYEDTNELGRLERLRALELGGARQLRSLHGLPASLERFNTWYAAQLVDLSGIEELPLVSISLDVCSRLENITPIRKIESLRYIAFSECKRLVDLSPLQGHPNVEVAMLIAFAGNDVSVLGTMPRLRYSTFPWTRGLRAEQGKYPQDDSDLDEFYAIHNIA